MYPLSRARGMRLVGLALLVAACGGAPHVATSAEGAPPAVTAPAVPPPPPPASFPPAWPFHAGEPAPHAAHGMVVTDNAIGTRVGVDVLASGGNAIDAAVATAFALAVSFPSAGNLGGGGFLVA
ncbi:MAG TPA: gamma-glutamyltransferase, partial [Polyangiaceae bacterium]